MPSIEALRRLTRAELDGVVGGAGKAADDGTGGDAVAMVEIEVQNDGPQLDAPAMPLAEAAAAEPLTLEPPEAMAPEAPEIELASTPVEAPAALAEDAAEEDAPPTLLAAAEEETLAEDVPAGLAAADAEEDAAPLVFAWSPGEDDAPAPPEGTEVVEVEPGIFADLVVDIRDGALAWSDGREFAFQPGTVATVSWRGESLTLTGVERIRASG